MSTDQERPRSATGDDARRPGEIPARGWKAIARRVKDEIKDDHVSLLAAGVAFKGLLALFPSLVAIVSIWGLVADPQQVTDQLQQFTSALPAAARDLLDAQMTQIAGQETGALSTALAVSIGLALWSASGGMAGLVEGCNAAYDETDARSFPVKRGLALLLTVGAIAFLLITVGLIAAVPVALDVLGLGPAVTLAVQVGQWVLLTAIVAGSLAVLYRYAPDRENPRFRWVSWGAVIATVLWLLGSAVFTLYVNSFGSFGATYGAFAGIIVLMLWLMLTAFVVLLGAELNAEIERQTLRDTTTGPPEPMGRRGAEPADTTPADVEEPRR